MSEPPPSPSGEPPDPNAESSEAGGGQHRRPAPGSPPPGVPSDTGTPPAGSPTDRYGQAPPGGTPPYGQPSVGQGGYGRGGQPTVGQPTGPPQYGQPEYGQPTFGQPPSGQPSYAQPPYGQPQYGQPPYGPPQYGQPQYGQPQYGQPQYGQRPYDQPQYGQPQSAPSTFGAPGGLPGRPPAGAGLDLTRRLGTRVLRRPDARFSPSLAAAGAALAILGALVWSIGYYVHGFHLNLDLESGSRATTSGEGRRFLGAGLFLVLTVLGYAAAIVRRRGPLATAGTVFSAIGVPLTLGFALLQIGDVFQGDYPINLDVLFPVSIVIWLASYFGVPGARGRAIYLALAATSFVSYIAFKAAGESALQAGFSATTGDGLGGGTGGGNDSGTVAAIGITFGLVYYAIAAFLDLRERPGAAVGMLYAGFVTTVGGLAASTDSFGQVGSSLTVVIVSAALAWYGGRFGRRFTTWAWSLGIVIGVAALVEKIGSDKYTLSGILLLVVGLAVAAGAQVLAGATKEQPDLVEAETGTPVAGGGERRH